MARTVNLAEHAARRDAILDAAQRLIMSKGHEHLTVQDILDELQISKGAFYHYFDSKPAVIEALAQRLVDDSVTALEPIVQDGELEASQKLQGFFSGIIRWKSARQNLFVAMLPVWYAPENVVFRLQVDRAVAKQLAPLLTVIVGQGVAEQRFATGYPEHAGTIIIALAQALQDAIAHQLLAAAHRSPDAPPVKQMVATYGAHIEAIERYLGAPAGTLYRADSRTMSSWISALRRAERAKSVVEGTR
jgi:AcrR family transcriptional regulator